MKNMANMSERVTMAPAERMAPLIMAWPPGGVRPANAED
jgi:hypothetical protein